MCAPVWQVFRNSALVASITLPVTDPLCGQETQSHSLNFAIVHTILFYTQTLLHKGPERSTEMSHVVMTLLLWSTLPLTSRAVGFNTDLQPACSKLSHEQNLHICKVTHEEFCFPGWCTYTVPPEFLTHLKNEDCVATWYDPDKHVLADPFHPANLQHPAVNVTLEHLITEQHVDGVWTDIRCHDTDKRYQAVYRATKNMVASPTASDPIGHTALPVWGDLLIVLCLVSLILGGIFYWKHTVILGWIRCHRDEDHRGMELEHMAQALSPNMDPN
ncbi:hypothetical protein MHYP_G00309610 [Metynnis hypsauchen]